VRWWLDERGWMWYFQRENQFLKNAGKNHIGLSGYFLTRFRHTQLFSGHVESRISAMKKTVQTAFHYLFHAA
jgi:hypothetical protein